MGTVLSALSTLLQDKTSYSILAKACLLSTDGPHWLYRQTNPDFKFMAIKEIVSMGLRKAGWGAYENALESQ